MVQSDGSQVMTVQELARYLRMKPVTIYKHAAQGKIPGFKVGASWRFKRRTIDKWIAGQESERKYSYSASASG